MLEYIIPFLFAAFCSAVFDKRNKEGRIDKICWALLYLYLTALLGFRFKVGGDSIIYEILYYWAPDLTYYTWESTNRFEPFFNLLYSIAKTISDEFFVFQIIHAVIFNTLLFIFVRKNTRYKYFAILLSFLLFYYYFATEILRETIAIMIFCFIYKFLEKKQYIPYFIGCIVAFLFHKSAVVLFVVPLLGYIKVGRSLYFSIFLIGILAIFLQEFLEMFKVFDLFSSSIEKYEETTSRGILADMVALLREFLFPLFFAIMVKFRLRTPLKYDNLLAIFILFGLGSFFSPLIFGRFANYFKVFFLIDLTDGIMAYMLRRNRFIHFVGVGLLCSYFLVYSTTYVMYRYYTRIIPYHSIFDPVEENRDSFNEQ